MFQDRAIVGLMFATLLTAATPASSQTDASATATPSIQSKPEERKQNHRLVSEVRHALWQTKKLDSSGIVVLARGGNVTLNGDAPDDAQIQMAAVITGRVPGVKSVTNNLHVHEMGN